MPSKCYRWSIIQARIAKLLLLHVAVSFIIAFARFNEFTTWGKVEWGAMDDAYGHEPSYAYEEPPPYSPIRRNGTNDFLIGKASPEAAGKEDGIVVRIARTWTRTTAMNAKPRKIARTTSDFLQHRTWPAVKDTTTTHVIPAISSAPQTTWSFIVNWIWKPIANYPLKASQFWGLLLLVLGIVPFVVYGSFMTSYDYGEAFFSNAFAAKTLGCGDSFGVPQNSTVGGWEALFVLDWTFGKFSFARVKTIDVAWDMVIGRGVQGIFWAICYRVFTDSLLRLIERHPASFETFKSICLEGAGLGSSCMLAKQLFRNRSIRTWFLFFYLVLSSFYVMSIPPLLGAMTGYDSTQIAWVSIDSSDNIIPSAQIEHPYVIYGTHNQSFESPICDSTTPELRDWYYHQQDMDKYCDCQLPNKTILSIQQWNYYYYSLSYYDAHFNEKYDRDACNPRFEGNDKTYTPTWGRDSGYERAKSWTQMNCNDTFQVELPNHNNYSMYDLNFTTYGFCFQNKSYDYNVLSQTTRCLPDTANPTYAWGFSSALMGAVIIINFAWCISMWILWQDAMLAKMVRDGYRMSPLRAAFALTDAARRRTGVRAENLVLRDRKLLRKELGRRKGKREAVVEKEVFEEALGEDAEGGKESGMRIRRRLVEGKKEDRGEV